MDTVKKTLNLLLTMAFGYMALGMASGLFYREFTKANGFKDGGAPGQLGLTHTHLLTLGFFVFLMILMLEKLFTLSRRPKLWGWFLGIYNAGVLITAVGMVWHGCLTILKIEGNPMIAGIAGMGHMLVTAGFVMLWVLLRSAIKAGKPATEVAAEPVAA